MPLQYPVLFPYGEDEWHRGLHSLGTLRKKQKRCVVTMREFFAYRLQQQEDKRTNILEGGKILQELIVEAYGGIEEQRLRWARNNQRQLRADLYQGLCDVLQSGILTHHLLERKLSSLLHSRAARDTCCKITKMQWQYAHGLVYLTFSSHSHAILTRLSLLIFSR